MAQRKQQQEIDRTLKRIQEGLAAFDGIYDKLQAQVVIPTSQTSQKEKLEQDLKKEIKKLQRHRDQIKTWAARDDIKDKKPLTDARKAIENEMERFKACEKEMKTKAFSKEGLLASSKMDPKEKERHEMGHFLMDMVEELGKQVEQAEAEQESLQIALKKGRKDPGKVERLTEVEHLVERHKWHQGRLELILRLLENGNIQTEQVASIKEDIDYYVNENQAVDFTEDEDIYNDLNLLEEEDMYGVGDDHQSSLDAQSVTEEYPPTPQKEEPIVKPRDPVVVPSNRRASVATNRPVVTSTTATAPPVPQPNGVPKPPPQAARPPIELKYASAVAAATNPASLLGLGPLPPPSSAPIRQASVSSIGSSTGRATSPITLISSGSSQLPTISSSVPIFPLNKDKPITAPNGSPKSATSPAVATPVPEPTTVPDAVSTPVSAPPELPAINALSLNGDVLSDSPTTFGLNGTDEADIAMLPPGLRDLLHSFQSARSRAEASSVSSAPVSTTGKMLEASRLGAPDAFDSESKKRYSPQTPYATPSYYPQLPHPVVVDPSFVRRCDVDTLFFMFYYQQETVQQYLAAKELKNQSWRFHKKYITWFQRHEEPKEIQETYEMGCYRYFDNQGSWVQRKKPEFQFMYAYLEDDD